MIVPAADAEQRAECARRRCDRGEAREPGGHRGAYYGGCPLRPQTRSRRRCARCGTSPARAGDLLRHRRHARADRRARRGRPRARGGARSCWAGWRAATAAWPASPGAPRPRRGGWSASAGSPTPAPTAPSCSSPAPTTRAGGAGVQELGAARAPLRRRARHAASCGLLRVRIEDKGPIAAFHWRGVPDEEAARDPAARGSRRRPRPTGSPSTGAARCSRSGRRCRSTRARPCATWWPAPAVRTALFGGDDATDLDAFDALDALSADGVLDAAVRVGVRSDEGPAAIVERADLVVDGVDGLHARAGGARRRLMRFRDFLRTAVLLFGGAATALAAVAVVGAGRNDDSTLVFVALGWWVLAAVVRAVDGPRGHHHARASPGCSPTPARANALPEFEPGHDPVQPALAAGAAGRGGRRARLLLPAGAGGGGGLRPARGAPVAQAVARRWRRSRDATAWSSGSTAARRSARRSCCALPGLRKIEPEDEAPSAAVQRP